MRDLPITGATQRELIEAVRLLVRGYGNNVLSVTLTPGATTTVVVNDIINEAAAPQLAPMTGNAAAALATTYVSAVAPGTLTLTHANNAQADRTFRVAILGG